MKICLATAALVLAAATSSPTLALDCAKASTGLEKKICADKRLMQADAAMAAAYVKLLKAATDPDVHAAVIESQRRWIAARETELGDLRDGNEPDADARPGGEAEEDNGRGRFDPRQILLDATTARTEDLGAEEGGKPRFIVEALKQRAAVSAFSGGPFAGYDVRCSFIPDRGDRNIYMYQCFGVKSVQHGDRVCAEEQDFASWSGVGRRAVADVVGGKPKVIASCTINSGNDSACPDMGSGGGSDARWNLAPTARQAEIGDGSARLAKLAPELLYLDEEAGWLKPCLTDKSFPASNPAADRSGK